MDRTLQIRRQKTCDLWAFLRVTPKKRLFVAQKHNFPGGLLADDAKMADFADQIVASPRRSVKPSCQQAQLS